VDAKAELSVDKKKDDLPLPPAKSGKLSRPERRLRPAGNRSKGSGRKSEDCTAPTRAELAEAQAKADLLIAQHRRARAVSKASEAKMAAGNGSSANAFDRMKRKWLTPKLTARPNPKSPPMTWRSGWRARKEDRIDQLLAELKTKRGA